MRKRRVNYSDVHVFYSFNCGKSSVVFACQSLRMLKNATYFRHHRDGSET